MNAETYQLLLHFTDWLSVVVLVYVCSVILLNIHFYLHELNPRSLENKAIPFSFIFIPILAHYPAALPTWAVALTDNYSAGSIST